MIAHSLKHIKDIEQIIVMKQGTIEAIGTHAELLNNNRFYTQLILQGE
jgi:ABC-type multidrug transport system fused ATPase/permease subunit